MKVLVLRKCTRGHKSNKGEFTYPGKGYVEAPDWNAEPHCGGGLHGLLWGHGEFDINSFGELWQVIEVDSENLVEFAGKCKFRSGNVLLTTESQLEAITLLKSSPNYPKDNILNYDISDRQVVASGFRSTQTAGDGSTQTAGGRSTQKAGDESTQTASDGSTQTAGDGSTQKAGDWSTQTASDESNQTAGYKSTQTAGDGSTQTAGYESTQTAGNGSTQAAGGRSTQKAGGRSTQAAGDWSTQTTDDESTQTAGCNSIQIGYWYRNSKHHIVSRKVTKAMANKPYRFEQGKWTVIKEER